MFQAMENSVKKKKRTERSAKRNWNAEQHHTEYYKREMVKLCIMQQKHKNITFQKVNESELHCFFELIWNIAVYGYIPFGIAF